MDERIPRLPSTTALRMFEASARHLSFSRAARELKVTQAAVSRQIRLLEEDIGQPLFVRLPRALLLTRAGQRRLARETEDWERLSAAITRVARAQPE